MVLFPVNCRFARNFFRFKSVKKPKVACIRIHTSWIQIKNHSIIAWFVLEDYLGPNPPAIGRDMFNYS